MKSFHSKLENHPNQLANALSPCTHPLNPVLPDPPLEEDEIPTGDWYCRACTAKKAKEENDKKEKLDKKGQSSGRGKGRKRKLPSVEEPVSDEIKKIRDVWKQLIENALASNPKEFKSDKVPTRIGNAVALWNPVSVCLGCLVWELRRKRFPSSHHFCQLYVLIEDLPRRKDAKVQVSSCLKRSDVQPSP
ncbi:hypothetical protein AAG570_012942 [Ranatra chinensis]|uniref:Uncharacterized protein n=1 Tax=Ranatra chinensis TaxID=642074 RepID=A0ABD0YFW5_9HEMI